VEDPNVEVVVRDGMVVARNVVIVVEEVIVVVVETDVTAEDEFVQAASVGKPTVSITVIIAKIILRLNIVSHSTARCRHLSKTLIAKV